MGGRFHTRTRSHNAIPSTRILYNAVRPSPTPKTRVGSYFDRPNSQYTYIFTAET